MKKKLEANLSRRTALKGAAAVAATATFFNINHAWSKDVLWDGKPFDAGGATLRIAEWGGFWEESVRKYLLSDFEKEYNCKISWDSGFPWFPKFTAGGPKTPFCDIANWNLKDMYQSARAGDFFLPLDDVLPNIPNAVNLWDFAKVTGLGITWSYGRYTFGYRTDLIDAPIKAFKDFWRPSLAGKRGTYVTVNELQMTLFLTSCAVFGKDEFDFKAGYEAMKGLVPVKTSDFTGNMQALLERGEVIACNQWDGEMWAMEDRGVKTAQYIWEEKKPLLTQSRTISKYAEPMQKKLAFAFMDRTLDSKVFGKFADLFYLRPTCKNIEITPKMATKGITNTADSVKGFWIPDYQRYLDHADEVEETVNAIFSA
ncbi:MAG: twin-arginine translocation signal domain-containing protein [Roseiarcus sp.]|jgi:putative spermidine/putrescine transport system substrate-binding protein